MPQAREPRLVLQQLSTGVPGLDEVLNGGLPEHRLYLIDGEPGTGKTTLGLQFLLAGAARGERVLYVTLAESREELEGVAASHGLDLDGVSVFELTETTSAREAYTLFHPAEVELQATMDALFKEVEAQHPQRVVFDSLSEMRLLARDPLRFRRQIMELKNFFAGRECTILILDDKSAPEGDLQLHSLAHGVIALEHLALEYGAERRRLQVNKLRGLRYRGGYHDFRILTGGMHVYPRILSTRSIRKGTGGLLPSGSAELDELLGGGVDRGSSVLITGAAGTGKSVLSTMYAMSAVERGEKVRFYLFDERIPTFRQRAAALNMPVEAALKSGLLTLHQVEPTELSPGEFASHVVAAVEDDTGVIIIDSINGYMQSMPEERLLAVQVHELLSYLSNNGVTCLMTLVQRGIFGSPVDEAAEVSYLADAVILLRYFEVFGRVRTAISVVKKRGGEHERTIREAQIGRSGMLVGEPLTAFQGVLTGVPEYTGETAPLMPQTGTATRK